MAVDYHGALNQLIRALQKVVARHDTGIVYENIHFSHLSTNFFSRRIHTFTLSNITHIGVNLRQECWDLLYSSNMSCG